jgi:hypothetical protein
MSAPRILKLGILADTKDLVDGLKKADDATRTAGDKIGSAFKKVGIAVAAAGAAVGAFAIALGKASIAEAIQAEAENNRLATILRNTGATEEQIKALNAQADALEKVGVVSGGNVKVVQSQLATFDLSTAAIQKLTPAVLDYVTAEKGANASADDFRSATNGLAQALNGNFASLTKVGFVLDETTKAQISNGTEAERAAAIVDVLNSTYEGFNETLTETAEGRLIQLRNQFDQIKERIGNVLLPVLVTLTKYFVDNILPVIDKLVGMFEQKASPAFTKISDIIKKDVVPIFSRIFDVIRKDLLPILQMFWGFIATELIPTLGKALKPVLDIIVIGMEFLAKKVRENKEGFEAFIGVVRGVWEFLKVYVIPLFQTALVTAIQEVFRVIGFLIDAFAQVFIIIQKVAKFLGQDLSFSLDTAKKATNNLNTGTVEAYKNFAQQSKTITEEVIPATNLLTAGTNALTASNKSLASSSKEVTKALKEQFTAKQSLDLIRSGFGSAIGVSGGFSLPGGESLRSAAELVGQFGGLVPGFNQSPNDPFFGFGRGSDINSFKRGSGGVVNINVNGTVVDPEGAARAIEQLISDSNARGGSVFTDLFGINP